jgi:hypothetical protein
VEQVAHLRRYMQSLEIRRSGVPSPPSLQSAATSEEADAIDDATWERLTKILQSLPLDHAPTPEGFLPDRAEWNPMAHPVTHACDSPKTPDSASQSIVSRDLP